MFELIPYGTKIPFMKYKFLMVAFSVIMSALSLYFIITKGFNYGVDFSGGVQIVLSLPADSPHDVERLRKSLESLGIKEVSVQSFGTQFEKKDAEYIVHFPGEFTNEAHLRANLEKALQGSPSNPRVAAFRFVGMERAYFTLLKDTPIDQVRAAVKTLPFGILELVDVQPFGRETSNEYQMNFKSIQETLKAALTKDFPSASQKTIVIEKVDFVGAKVGKDLKLGALLSLIITGLLIFVFIFIRFDLNYAPGVVVAGVHDVLITAGAFSYFGFEFDLTTVAALLTLAGYSINDTIIVYDRIREVSLQLKGKKFEDVIDLAVNQTLSRTIITSLTVFIVSVVMWIYGGPVIHGFSFALCVGIIVGTYSSVFVAAPMILLMENFTQSRQAKARRAA
ncbi:MAG: protein translocase subunit SecF [Deltaproteobacteria bacterium]|nr:protein translocase subunit SecF [Deltaproteobacteria bacterium]